MCTFKLDSSNPEAPVLTWCPRTPKIQTYLCSRDPLNPLVQILRAEPAPPMIFFSVGLFLTLSPVSTAEKIAGDDRDALFSSVLCPEPTVTGVTTDNNMGERGYSRRTSFVLGTPLKWKSLGQHFSQLVCPEHYSLKRWETKKEEHRSDDFEKWRFYRPTGTFFWNPWHAGEPLRLKGEIEAWGFDHFPLIWNLLQVWNLVTHRAGSLARLISVSSASPRIHCRCPPLVLIC